jgi:ribonuclease HII
MSRSSSTLGIDEAGYGPTLGPLVMGFVRVDGPPGALAEAFRTASEAVEGFPDVGDSKRLYQAGRLHRVEAVALGAACVAVGRAADWDDLTGTVDGRATHPWYARLPNAPTAADAALVAAGAEALRDALERSGARIARIGAHVHLEGPLNARFDRFGNKGSAHLAHVEAVVADAWPDGGTGRVRCDRLGGRKFYGDLLARVFPFRAIDVLEESEATSRYLVDDGVIEASFSVGGEAAFAEIALASCVAKTIREIYMEAFNAWFSERFTGLQPTAGYPEDAVRWLADVERADPSGGWRARLARTR